jgi:hypothetical protein
MIVDVPTQIPLRPDESVNFEQLEREFGWRQGFYGNYRGATLGEFAAACHDAAEIRKWGIKC